MERRNNLQKNQRSNMTSALKMLFFILTINSPFLSISQELVRKIDRIDIYFLPLNLKIHTRVGPESIKKMSITKKITTNEDLGLQKYLDKLKLKENWDSIDLRVLCEIYYLDGKMDSVGFNKHKMVLYNGTVYKKNRRLFKKIYSHCK